jgi:hypothetical protein
MKSKNVVNNAAPVSNNVDGTNIKENDMTNSTSGMVTMTVADFNALKERADKVKKPGEKSLTSAKVWMCTYTKAEINMSIATPQHKKIMHAIRQEHEANPDIEFHASSAIMKRMLDPENDTAFMHFTAKYQKAADPNVRVARLVEVLTTYAHRDVIEAYELDPSKFNAR